MLARFDAAALKRLASAADAPLGSLTLNDDDLDWVELHAQQHFQAASGDGQQLHWKDAGYWLCWPLLLIALFCIRRGWRVHWLSGLLLAMVFGLPAPRAQAGALADAFFTPEQQGRWAFEHQHYPQAAAHFSDPYWKGLAAYQAADYQAALASLARLDTAPAYFYLGNSYVRLSNFEQAIAAYKKALSLQPAFPEASANLALALALQKEADEQQEAGVAHDKADKVELDNTRNQGKLVRQKTAKATSDQLWLNNLTHLAGAIPQAQVPAPGSRAAATDRSGAMKPLVLLLGLLLSLPALAEPEVRIRTQLVQADSVVVGGTLQLQVDVLVDTWFTDAPQLPKLELDGALVSEPNSEATHLNEQLDGKTFFGLRFLYQITPQRAQRFDIPALTLRVQPGQGSGWVTLNSQPQHFSAQALQGQAGEHALVARQVEFTQEIVHSHEPLRVGDSVTRRLHVRAEGAQAMLIPPPPFADVDGLKRYVQTPEVKPLSDGRGGVIGGARDDAVTYVVKAAGSYSLPAIELSWWDAGAGQARRVAVPELSFQAKAAASYRAPFSITDDLRALGQKTQVHLAIHWLLLATVLPVVALAGYFGKPWALALAVALKKWREGRRKAWLDSAEFAWRLAGQQLAARPAQLGGLYLWLRRRTGSRELVGLFRQKSAGQANRLLAFFNARYAAGRQDAGGIAELQRVLPELRQALRQRPEEAQSRQALKSLNP